jgi:tetraacyldisaccharide 4'-kinase
VNPLLKSAELLYRGINRSRRFLYRKGILRARRLPRPVISIGNLSAGGAGKTPAAIAITRFLLGRGYRVAVLTRGYGREGAGGMVRELDAARYGDEPVLIKKQLPKADVIVGANRYESAHESSADIYVLDDGFQHLQLHRDVDIVIDVRTPRFRREGPSALRYADIVLQRDLRLRIPPAIRERRIFAFAGLADNAQFFESLRSAGLDLVGTLKFPDHHRYVPADLDAIRAAATTAGAATIVTTEKDHVKLASDEIIAIPAEMVIDERDLERMLAMISK